MWKIVWKSWIALGDIASWNVLMFLKLVAKWREIQKSKLNNSLINWAFQKQFFTLLFLSRLSRSFKIIYLFWHILKFIFCSQSCDVIFKPKTLKSKNKKHKICLEYKVLPSCKVWAQTNKKCKSSSYLAIFCVLYAHRGLRPPLKRKISLFHVVVLVMAKNCTKKCDEHTELVFCLSNLRFFDVLVAIAVVGSWLSDKRLLQGDNACMQPDVLGSQSLWTLARKFLTTDSLIS